jgi:hypothetical protein
MNMTTQNDRVTLYYRQGSSDKVYQAAIEPKENGFIVTFAYGRRGGTLNTGTKTSSPVDRSTAQKRNMLDRLRKNGKEGAVFKNSTAPYTPGRPASGGSQLKLKFTATASCIVAERNGRKRRVALELIESSGRIGVGNVTIPPNHAIPGKGNVVEVRYLYAHPGGSLYQPVYLGLRDDIAISDCIIGQLKFKTGEQESE